MTAIIQIVSAYIQIFISKNEGIHPIMNIFISPKITPAPFQQRKNDL